MYTLSSFYFNISVCRTSKGIFATDNKTGSKFKIADYRAGPLDYIASDQIKKIAIVCDSSFGDLSEAGKVIKRQALDFIKHFNLENYSYACLFREAVKVNN